MEHVLAVFGGALIGATAVLCSGFVVETYRRHRDRQAMALAIAGEISALTNATERRRAIEVLPSALRRLDVGVSPLEGYSRVHPPTIERFMEKVGLLGGDFPFRIAAYGVHLREYREILGRVSNDKLDCAAKASAIRDACASWDEAYDLARDLMDDLLMLAREPFGIGRLRRWKSMRSELNNGLLPRHLSLRSRAHP
jgi:hypothetical protein